jgi:hypothetical protein
MPYRHFALVLVGLALAGCATPLERCINDASRDLRVIDNLIREAQGNLARGYALDEVQVPRTVYVECLLPPIGPTVDASGQPVPPRKGICPETVFDTVSRPRSIDLAAERQKLDSMLAKRRQLERTTERAVAACRANFPEEG